MGEGHLVDNTFVMLLLAILGNFHGGFSIFASVVNMEEDGRAAILTGNSNELSSFYGAETKTKHFALVS